MDKISVYIDVYDFDKNRFTDLIIECRTLHIPSREHAIAAAKALIDHYSIKQEELYPWIACSDRMPVKHQEVLVGWKLDKHKEHTLSAYYIGDNGKWYLAFEGDLADWEIEGNVCPRPTHWHPIPTL